MEKGGKRDNSGRRYISGKKITIKLEDNLLNEIEKIFSGKTKADKIRNCIKEGILLKKIEKGIYKNMEKKYRVLDMFCGAGGLSKGFIDANYEVILGVDFDEVALKTFEANHGNAKGIKLDLFKDNDMNYLINEAKKSKIDIIIGGPPCQGFSLAGSRNPNDDRNKLYERMVQLSEIIKPKAIVIENVPGLATLYNGIAKKKIIEDFNKLGYKMSEPKILYAPDYGIPQIRKRLFFVGLLNSDIEFKYPDPICKESDYVTCEEAISDLPSLENSKGKCPENYINNIDKLSDYQKLMRKNSKEIRNHISSIHTEQTKYLISKVPEGKTYKSLPDEDPICRKYKENAKYNELLTRYHSKKPSLTINTGHRTHFHYKYNRIPTVRENARLQSFPDDFIFYGNKSQQYRQVGNAVPPMIGYYLGLQLKKFLGNLEENKNEKI